ncbi:MAG: type II toxin-antitoxin system Phd/YefM family antitoxin [Cyanobium sp.]
MTDSNPVAPRLTPSLAVPLAEAKNHFSALVARVEQGEEIAITRRGVPVVRLVPHLVMRDRHRDRQEMVAAALERLHQLRTGVVLEGDLKAMAREGLD